MTKLVIFLVKLFSCLVALSVWLTIGLVIWVAKIIRVVAAFTFKVSLQAFKEQNMQQAEKNIHTAISFWPNGIRRILKIFDSAGVQAPENNISWSQVAPGLTQDILFSIFLFFSIYLMYRSYNPPPQPPQVSSASGLTVQPRKTPIQTRQVIPSITPTRQSQDHISSAAYATAKTYGCFACHDINNKVVGPSFRAVAERYSNDEITISKIVSRVKSGGRGIWGTIPEPPNKYISEQELTSVVRWILTIN